MHVHAHYTLDDPSRSCFYRLACNIDYGLGVGMTVTMRGLLWHDADADGKPGELLLLHVDAATKKQSLRSCSQKSSSSTIKPSEIKYGPTLGSMMRLQASHAVTLQLPVTGKVMQLRQALTSLVNMECTRIR